MIKYYMTVNNAVTEISEQKQGCWISVTAPNAEEIEYIISEFGLDAGFVRSSLDEEESSRIEVEENQTLIIVDYAVADKGENKDSNAVIYYTMPMGIILTQTNVVTISIKQNIILDEMSSGIMKGINTSYKTKFVLLILLRIAYRFLQYLKQIDKLSYFTERQLHKTMKNKELIQLLDLEKSLVYFSTSLKSNEVTLEKILRGRVIRLYEEDQDLLEDVLIEIKQAIEMSNIYSRIISGMMDALSSIISNNVNVVMKRLTIITILMAIPTIVFSFYGMNVEKLPFISTPLAPLIISIISTGMLAGILLKKDD